jgi:hypothetical protein
MSMGAQLLVITEKPLATCGKFPCGCRKFQLDPLGDHLNTCTVHSGTKKTHDWMVDQVPDFFRTTHQVKTQEVVKNRGQHCGDIDLTGYLTNETDPVSLVLDLRMAHDRVGSSSDPSLNGHLKYPNNLDQSLNDTAADKIRKYRSDYNNRPPSEVSFMPAIPSTSGRLHSEFVRLLFLQPHRETETLVKAVALRINLNLDGTPIASKSHTHPSHSQTSRLLTSSLSLGVPVPRPTQCVRGA